jgi:UDP-2,4-diacetamido-2,4,6-trideoxy-beta-L-altropyranose hydrolase
MPCLAKRIFVIDDLANRFHSADLLRDQTYQREASDYKSYVSENCVLLVGVDYALLRTEFCTERLARLKTRFESSEPKRILISLGSTDTHQLTVRALEATPLSGLRLKST